MEAETERTDMREGRRMEPVVVECPECGRAGPTDHEVNMCEGCGTWFRVTPAER